MAVEIGQRVGDYEALALLGSGGMGRVYKVRNIISNREEAMKVLLPDFASEAELAARFMAEIRTLAGLEHPNIAQLRTAFQWEKQFVMIMEFVEGTTLEKLAQTNIQLDQILDYSTQVLSALSYAHSRGVTHRDIKPANIMVTPHGLVKLMDFGIAKSANDLQLTRPGTTMGSVYYISPEQVGGGTVDARSDIYSFGVTLYEMLTGRRPFQADTSFAVLYAHMNEAPPPPAQFNPSLPAALNDIVLKAMNKAPEARFQTADEFRNALKAARKPQAAPQVAPPVLATQLETPAPPQQPFAPQAASPFGAQSQGFAAVALSATGVSSPSQGFAPVAAAAPLPASSPQGFASVPAPAPVPISNTGKSHRGLWIGLGALAAVLALVAAATVLPRVFATHASQKAASAATDSAAATPAPAPAPPPTASAPVSTPPAVADAQPASTPAVTPEPAAAAPAAQAGNQAGAQPAVKKPRQMAAVAQSAQLAPAPAAAPAPPPGPSKEEIRTARDRLMNLDSRAEAARSGIGQMQRQQQAQGLDMRGDILAAQSRMNNFLREADRAVAEGDLAAAHDYMERADREISTLESFLGR